MSEILKKFGSLEERLNVLSQENAGLPVPKPTTTRLPEYRNEYNCKVNPLLGQLENESKILILIYLSKNFCEFEIGFYTHDISFSILV